MPDRTTKALLFAIAVGLWMNAAAQWLPVAGHAQDDSKVVQELSRIESRLLNIDNRLSILDSLGNLRRILDSVEGIGPGRCSNRRIC
jgi:hypothetical protein